MVGIIVAVTTLLYQSHCNLLDAQQFSDELSARFARIELRSEGAEYELAAMQGYSTASAPSGRYGRVTSGCG